LSKTPFETTAQQELRANCISTIGCILDSVKSNPEISKQDALEITQGLVDLLASGKLADDDAQLASIQAALPQLAGCLKADFSPFLPTVFDQLVKDMTRDLDFKIVDADEAELEEGDAAKSGIQKINVQVKGYEGARQIQMNTAALENMISAIDVASCIAQELGSLFFDKIEPFSVILCE
jgi:hypothetical protein